MIKGTELDTLVLQETRLSLKAFAEALGYNGHTCYRWRNTGVSRSAAVLSEQMGLIKAHQLRPDMFADPEKLDKSPSVMAAIRRRADELLAMED